MNERKNSAGGSGLYALEREALIVGTGGGGGNAVSRMAPNLPEGLRLLAINSDLQALAACAGVETLQIGERVTDGLGAGGDTAMGKLAAEEDRQLIIDAVFGARFVALVVGLGGGVGTGAAPVVAEIARESGALTICFATLPFAFEGEKRRAIAEEGLKALMSHCDVVVRLPNDHLLAAQGEQAELATVFARADEMLGVGIGALCGLLFQTGVINLDFADMRQLVQASGGLCAFGYGEAHGARRVEEVTSALRRSPVLAERNDLNLAETVLVNIVGGSDLTLNEVQAIVAEFRTAVRPNAHILLGAAVNREWSDRIAVTVLVPYHPRSLAELVDLAVNREESPALSGAEAPADRLDTERMGAQKRRRARQTKLNFDPTEKGRFKNVEPTIYEGEDLDVPTFIRRGVKLSIER